MFVTLDSRGKQGWQLNFDKPFGQKQICKLEQLQQEWTVILRFSHRRFRGIYKFGTL